METLGTLILFGLFILFLAAPQVLYKISYPILYAIYIPTLFVYVGLRLFLRNIPKIVAVTIGSALIILIWLITTFVSLFGKFRAEHAVETILEATVRHQNITRVRDDLLCVLPLEPEKGPSSHAKLHKLRDDAKSKLQTAELIFTVSTAVLFLAIPSVLEITPVNLQTLIQIYIMILTPAIVIRIYLLDVLAFKTEDEVDDFGIERAMLWQQAVTQTQTVTLYILLISLFARISNRSYNDAIAILDLRFSEDTGYINAIKEVRFSPQN